jgi:cell division protein FtsB
MFTKLKNNQIVKSIIDPKNLGMYVLVVIAVSITWSSIKVIQKNYELEKQITVLQQEVNVLDQQTKNQKLKNEYYKTDAYLDIAARKYFNKAIPGEQLILVPSEVADIYIHRQTADQDEDEAKNNRPQFIQNLQDWIDFFLHREPS